MLRTYKAILRGNRLEWDEAAPETGSADQPIAVHVTILDSLDASLAALTTGQQMAAVLEQLARETTRTVINDPVAWQREQRRDRDLPDREG